MVVDYLRSLKSDLQDFRIRHRALECGPDGEFELDALAQFQALGASFLVIVECKHQRRNVKRDAVQILRDRVRALSAHKGMLFSTGGFQAGAIEYAMSQRIALVHFTEGGPIYETKALNGPTSPSRPYDAYLVSHNEKGNLQYGFGSYDDASDYLFTTE